MCRVAIQNGHKVEMLEEVSGVSSCDVLFDGKKCELKSVSSVSNLSHRMNKAVKQGAKMVLLELSGDIEALIANVLFLKEQGLQGYYYIKGQNALFEI